jgi:hypothetical protein
MVAVIAGECAGLSQLRSSTPATATAPPHERQHRAFVGAPVLRNLHGGDEAGADHDRVSALRKFCVEEVLEGPNAPRIVMLWHFLVLLLPLLRLRLVQLLRRYRDGAIHCLAEHHRMTADSVRRFVERAVDRRSLLGRRDVDLGCVPILDD